MRGTERVAKTIEERLDEKGGAFLKGKEGFCPPVRGTEGIVKTIEGRFSKRYSLSSSG